MARRKPTSSDLTAQSAALTEFAARSLVVAEQSGLRKKPIKDFPLDDDERAIAADLPGLSATLKRKLRTRTGNITVADTASIVTALAESLFQGQPLQRLR